MINRLIVLTSTFIYLSFGNLFILVLPDTQYYNAYFPDIFSQQTEWIYHCKDMIPFDFIVHLGDIVEHGNLFEIEWKRASYSVQSIIESEIPFSVLPGNHDVGGNERYKYYDKWFPRSLFDGKSWYIDSYPNNTNRNSYQIITTKEGESILFMSVEWLDDGQYSVSLDWISNVLSEYSNYFVVLSSHDSGSDCDSWIQPLISNIIFNNCNVKLVLGGHNFQCSENVININNQCGNSIPVIVTDYQGRDQGGYGWLRYYELSLRNKELCAYTFSPTLNQFEYTTNGWFSINLTNDIKGNGCEIQNICGSKFLPPALMSFIYFLNFQVILMVVLVFVLKPGNF